MKKFIVFICLYSFAIPVVGQQIGGRFSNNVTSLPITGFPKLFYTQFHPGLELNYRMPLKEFSKSRILLEGGLGVFYHRFFQTGVRLTGTAQYEHDLGKRFALFGGIGGGYMHSFYQYSIFKLNSEGQYMKISGIKGKPQFTVQLGIGATYKLFNEGHRNTKLVFECRTFVHGTFAKAYVPVVPYNCVQLGVLVDLYKNGKQKTESNENK